MKKQIILLAIALTALFSACQEKEILSPSNDGMITLKAGLEDDEPDTKTYLGEKSGNYTPIYWSAGDKIKVNGTSYTLVSGENTPVGEFNVAAAEKYYAVYPQTLSTSDWTGGDTIYVSLPATQPYTKVSSKSTIAPGVLPMVGYSSSENIKFRNICGVLIFNIEAQGVDKVKSITITCDAAHNISGPGVVSNANTIQPTLVMNKSDEAIANNTITITTPSGGVSISGSEAFYAVLPVGLYESLSVAIETEAHGTLTKEYSNIYVFAGETRKSEVVTVPSYSQYLGNWKIYSLMPSSSSKAAYVDITISAKVEGESYTITTAPMEYSGNTTLDPIPTYPFNLSATYDPTNGKISILPGKVAKVKYSESGEDDGVDMDLVALAYNGSQISSNSAACLIGTWSGSEANPTIDFEGSDYEFTSGTQKVSSFLFYVYSGTERKTSSSVFKLTSTANVPIRIVKNADKTQYADYIGTWKLYGIYSSGAYKEVTITELVADTSLLMTVPNFAYKGGTDSIYHYDLKFVLRYSQSTGNVLMLTQVIATDLTIVSNNGTYSGQTLTDADFRACAYAYYIGSDSKKHYSIFPSSTSGYFRGSMSGRGATQKVIFEGTSFESGGNTYFVEKYNFYPYAKGVYTKNDRLRSAAGGSLQTVFDLPIHLSK